MGTRALRQQASPCRLEKAARLIPGEVAFLLFSSRSICEVFWRDQGLGVEGEGLHERLRRYLSYHAVIAPHHFATTCRRLIRVGPLCANCVAETSASAQGVATAMFNRNAL